MSEELKTILDKLEIVARKHTIEVCEDGSKIETMPASIVDELRLNNYSAKLLLNYIQQKENIIKEVREKVDNFDVFKEFTFPLMKRDEEQQVKSSIDYEWRKSIKEPILEILEKENK